ncbi:MAG: acetyltransferase [Mucinivorans sp.]
MKPLILIGGGGHCKSVIQAAESAQREIAGVLDVKANVGHDILGYRVIGTDDDIAQYAAQYEFVITVGHIKDCAIRQAIDQKIAQADGTLATIVAGRASVSRHATIGPGTVVLQGAMVNAGARVGRNCIINTLSNVEHDAVVGDFCHISTGAMVNGDCTVGENTFLGSQSVMLNGASICAGCVVAAASFVRKPLKVRGIYAGNPAILMKKL